MSKKTIVVGMSGGVDSSVTALLLKEQGFIVIGVIMYVWDGDPTSIKPTINKSCYGPSELESIESAKNIASKIGIPLKVINLASDFDKYVIQYFKQEYKEARTPNPCVQCNQKIKFGALIQKIEEIGIKFDYFATGHYVRKELNKESNRYLLKKGKDNLKDQSYFLAFLNQEQLRKCCFPLGNYHKEEIRKISKRGGLSLEEVSESQNFAAMGHKSILENTSKPGDFIDESGKVLGKHEGISFYTIGQRRGLGIAWAHPLYVIKINKDENTILLGPREKLLSTTLIASDLNWIAFKKLSQPLEVTAKIRYVQKEDPAIITPFPNGTVQVEFLSPQTAVTPGQAIVFYQDDLVIGGGIIKE